MLWKRQGAHQYGLMDWWKFGYHTSDIKQYVIVIALICGLVVWKIWHELILIVQTLSAHVILCSRFTAGVSSSHKPSSNVSQQQMFFKQVSMIIFFFFKKWNTSIMDRNILEKLQKSLKPVNWSKDLWLPLCPTHTSNVT